MARVSMESLVGSDQPRNVAEAMEAARSARSPADVAAALFLVCAYQQQQIQDLEMAVGLQDVDSTDAIRARAKAILEHRRRAAITGLTG